MNLFLQRISELQGNDSVSSFARRIGVPQKTLDHLVKGELKPSVDVILALAKSCNVSSDWLLGLSKTQGTPTVNAGSGAAVNIGSGSATAGGDCSKCRLMQAHVRQITGRA